jgi:hypothetical protein
VGLPLSFFLSRNHFFGKKNSQDMEKLFERGLKEVTSVFERIAALWESTSNGESELQTYSG